MKKILLPLLSAFLFIGCCSGNDKEQAAQPSRTLVLYYSQTGATRSVAEALCERLGCAIDSVMPFMPYDGTFDETVARCQQERTADSLPTIQDLHVSLDDYDTIFLGYPIWFGTYARPIVALVAKYDFAGKVIIPFCTFGSGGLQSSSNDLATSLPKATILQGFGIRNARLSALPAELDHFLIEQGYKEGTPEILPDFGELVEVDDVTRAIFNEACGNYQFPLGTPVKVASRTLSAATEYAFIASSKDAAGNETTTTIYVLKPSDGSKAEFTQVVR